MTEQAQDTTVADRATILAPQGQVPLPLCPQRAVMDDWPLPGPPVPSLIWGHGVWYYFLTGSNIPLLLGGLSPAPVSLRR